MVSAVIFTASTFPSELTNLDAGLLRAAADVSLLFSTIIVVLRPTNELKTSEFPVNETWKEEVNFALSALLLLFCLLDFPLSSCVSVEETTHTPPV